MVMGRFCWARAHYHTHPRFPIPNAPHPRPSLCCAPLSPPGGMAAASASTRRRCTTRRLRCRRLKCLHATHTHTRNTTCQIGLWTLPTSSNINYSSALRRLRAALLHTTLHPTPPAHAPLSGPPNHHPTRSTVSYPPLTPATLLLPPFRQAFTPLRHSRVGELHEGVRHWARVACQQRLQRYGGVGEHVVHPAGQTQARHPLIGAVHQLRRVR